MNLLATRLSPHLSSHALDFWIQNSERFGPKGLYSTGYSGLAIRISKYVFWMTGVSTHAKAICHANTIEEQVEIYEKKIRPTLLHPLFVKCLFANPVFLWKSLGVPMNQMNMYLKDGKTAEYIAATLDPLPKRSLFKDDNYFYHVCLQSCYSRDSCPAYLKKENYEQLSSAKALDAFRIHTDYLQEVMKDLEPDSITKAILMDHADWFDTNGETLLDEIQSLKRVVKSGGKVLFRSAAKSPWYVALFEDQGFQCERVSIRELGQSIDRYLFLAILLIPSVNMYASTWVATKS